MKLAILSIETSTQKTFFQSQNKNLKFVMQFAKKYSMPLYS